MFYPFYIFDVFSAIPFGGNQLAVLPMALGISDEGMQRIAAEFNFAETAFILPTTSAGCTRRLRIFTPLAELPFAGHPTIGAACALVHGNHVAGGHDTDMTFEMGIGPVNVNVRQENDTLNGSFTLFSRPNIPRESPDIDDMAKVLSIGVQDIAETFFASVGLPFCFVRVRSREIVDRAKIDHLRWHEKLSNAYSTNVFIFGGSAFNGAELYARMFAPALGVHEDPATGSACAALVGALALRAEQTEELYRISIYQGVLMGRPSRIDAVARLVGGDVTYVSISGTTSFVAEGGIDVPVHLLLNGSHAADMFCGEFNSGVHHSKR